MVRIDRRHALGLLGAAALFGPRAMAQTGRPRVLVLVELKGGNDGLNTVVPYRDEAYRRLRPQLGLNADEVMPLEAASGIALHGALAPLMPAYAAGALAVVQGVGYPQPNRSHFRSIDIWNAASGSDEVKSRGWLADVGDPQGPLFALNLAPTGPGPLTGAASMLTLPQKGASLPPPRAVSPGAVAPGRSAALRHVVRTAARLQDASEDARAALAEGASHVDAAAFGKTRFGQDMARVATLIIGGAGRVFRVQLNGFDTHKNQRGVHARLLGELATALAAFRTTLVAAERFDDVTLATYAEFGRRAGENKSGGTDHGTAAPHFVLGGRVRGGLIGAAPVLTDLDAGDLRHTVDFRALYRTLAQHAFGVTPTTLRPFAALPLFA